MCSDFLQHKVLQQENFKCAAKSCFHRHMHLSTLRLWFEKHNLKEQTETAHKKPSKCTMDLVHINILHVYKEHSLISWTS